MFDGHLRTQKIAPDERHGVEPRGGKFDLFVLHQAAHQVGTRVFGLMAIDAFAWRQEHARLDLDEHRCHQQIVAGQLQVVSADLFNIVQVLARHVGQRDVQDVEVLLADEVQQQVQRAFKGFKKNLQRVGRDVQVMRQLEERLAVQARQCHLVHQRGHVRCQRRLVSAQRDWLHCPQPLSVW